MLDPIKFKFASKEWISSTNNSNNSDYEQILYAKSYAKCFMCGFSQVDVTAATLCTYYYYPHFIEEETKT